MSVPGNLNYKINDSHHIVDILNHKMEVINLQNSLTQKLQEKELNLYFIVQSSFSQLSVYFEITRTV